MRHLFGVSILVMLLVIGVLAYLSRRQVRKDGKKGMRVKLGDRDD